MPRRKGTNFGNMGFTETCSAIRPLPSAFDVGLWRTQPLAPVLYKVLGPRLETLLINMQEAGPIRGENGIVYVTGNKKYATDRAALVVDTRTDALYVWLLVDGRSEEYQWGDSVALPKPVLDLVERSEPTP